MLDWCLSIAYVFPTFSISEVTLLYYVSFLNLLCTHLFIHFIQQTHN